MPENDKANDTSALWLGLHNPERHYAFGNGGDARCETCISEICARIDPCRCCLHAEVEALQANLEEIAADHNEMVVVAHDLRQENKTLRERIQRVREVAENEDYRRIFAEYGSDAELIRVVPLDALNAALDGER